MRASPLTTTARWLAMLPAALAIGVAGWIGYCEYRNSVDAPPLLTLLESGRRRDIKAVWVRRIMEAQRPDGGWDGVDVIAHLPGDRVLAWAGGRLYPVITSRPASTFHATAQGLYLLALLLQDGH